MECMLEYPRVIKKERVFIVDNNKDIRLHDILDGIRIIDNAYKGRKELEAIVDISTNDIQVHEAFYSTIFKEVKVRIRKYDKVRFALIVNNPVGVALSLLMEYQVSNSNYLYKTFSTQEAAIEWLQTESNSNY